MATKNLSKTRKLSRIELHLYQLEEVLHNKMIFHTRYSYLKTRTEDTIIYVLLTARHILNLIQVFERKSPKSRYGWQLLIFFLQS